MPKVIKGAGARNKAKAQKKRLKKIEESKKNRRRVNRTRMA